MGTVETAARTIEGFCDWLWNRKFGFLPLGVGRLQLFLPFNEIKVLIGER